MSVSSSAPPTPLASAASNAKKAWRKIRGLSRGAQVPPKCALRLNVCSSSLLCFLIVIAAIQAFRESTQSIPQSPLSVGGGMVGRHNSSGQYLGQNQADDDPRSAIAGQLSLGTEEAGGEAEDSSNVLRGL